MKWIPSSQFVIHIEQTQYNLFYIISGVQKKAHTLNEKSNTIIFLPIYSLEQNWEGIMLMSEFLWAVHL